MLNYKYCDFSDSYYDENYKERTYYFDYPKELGEKEVDKFDFSDYEDENYVSTCISITLDKWNHPSISISPTIETSDDEYVDIDWHDLNESHWDQDFIKNCINKIPSKFSYERE